MSMVIAHNISGKNTRRRFGGSTRSLSCAMEKLSSGFKINSGMDDPAGLLISEKLRSQIAGITCASQNASEVINSMGIAEGALNEMSSILKKMESLATHSSNTGVTNSDQIAADPTEMDSAIQTMDRVAQTTNFAGDNLLNGTKAIAFTAIAGTQQNQLLNARGAEFTQIFKCDGYSVSVNYDGAIDADLATGIRKVDFSKQAMKAYFEVDTADNLDQTDGHGRFSQTQQFTLIDAQGSRSFTFSKGETVMDFVRQIKSTDGSAGVDAGQVFNSEQHIGGTAEVSFDPDPDAAATLKAGSGDDVFGRVRFDFALSSLSLSNQDLADALDGLELSLSDIRDSDMASEMAEFTKNQILQNAATTMMSNTNLSSQNVLQLLW